MKKYFLYTVVALVAFGSCSKIDDSRTGADIPDVTDTENHLVFTATIEKGQNVKSKITDNEVTWVAGNTWQSGDTISVNGIPYIAESSGSSTKFKLANYGQERPTVVYGAPGVSASEGPEKLLDREGTATKWTCDWMYYSVFERWDLFVAAPRSNVLKSIYLWNGDDIREHPDRRWRSINVYGRKLNSGDHSRSGSFEFIGTFDNLNLLVNGIEGDPLYAGRIDVNDQEAYKEYWIQITKVENYTEGWGDDVMMMSDMKFQMGGTDARAPFKAFFPPYLYDGETSMLPSVIQRSYWYSGQFDMPMYAYSTDTDLHFSNLTGALAVNVGRDQVDRFKKITLSSSNRALSGKFTINDDKAAVLVEPANIQNTLTVEYPVITYMYNEGDHCVIHVPIPAQTYRDLCIEISDGSNSKRMTTKSGVDIVVERSKIYHIDFKADDVE